MLNNKSFNALTSRYHNDNEECEPEIKANEVNIKPVLQQKPGFARRIKPSIIVSPSSKRIDELKITYKTSPRKLPTNLESKAKIAKAAYRTNLADSTKRNSAHES